MNTASHGLSDASHLGLSAIEAKRRLAEEGPNVLQKKTANAAAVFARQFKSSLIYLLLVACVISFVIGDGSDGFVILAILIINTALGFYQEFKSEKIVEKLSHFISRQAQVVRDGKTELIPAAELVLGDAVIVREGDIVPADLRAVSSEGLQVDESQLTGESVPVTKKAGDALFTGSLVEKGYGSGIVTATGKNTKLGSIAVLSEATKKETQYEKSLRSFSAFLVKAVLVCLALLIALKLAIALAGGSGLFMHAANVSLLILFVIALAVAVVPEALPVIVTVTLSQGALALAKKHVVVKRLSSLEDLGNVTLLCTDKTGTITENKMSVKAIVPVRPGEADLLLKLFYAANAGPGKRRHHKNQSNPFADALEHHIPEKLKSEAGHFKIEAELPFDPESRRAYAVITNIGKAGAVENSYLIAIGAPEFLEKDFKNHQGQGFRNIGLSYKAISGSGDPAAYDIVAHTAGLHFLGYISFEDPLRPTARPTIELAKKLGVAIKIISGDSTDVVAHVGREVGLVGPEEKVFTGDELEAIRKGVQGKNPHGESEYEKTLIEHHAFARVSPRQKYDIIQALQKTNVVGYQGDGINDAPALKLADVAIAVDSATDIAQENSDIILLSRNLEVVVNAIHSGRSMFVNIDKYIKYTMVGNFGNFLALSALYLTSTVLPILPIQILLTNLLTDIPLISIASDTVATDEIRRPTRHNPRELIFVSLLLGIPTALFELAYFGIVTAGGHPAMFVDTGLFVFLSFQLVIFFSIRSRGAFYKVLPPSTLLVFSFIAGSVVSIGVIYVPWFERVFSFTPLPPSALALIVLMTAGYFIVLDVIKVLYYRIGNRKD